MHRTGTRHDRRKVGRRRLFRSRLLTRSGRIEFSGSAPAGGFVGMAVRCQIGVESDSDSWKRMIVGKRGRAIRKRHFAIFSSAAIQLHVTLPHHSRDITRQPPRLARLQARTFRYDVKTVPPFFQQGDNGGLFAPPTNSSLDRRTTGPPLRCRSRLFDTTPTGAGTLAHS